MSREMLKSLIEYIPQQDIDTVYKVIVKFNPVPRMPGSTVNLSMLVTNTT